MKSICQWGLWLCVVALTALACNAPSLPALTKAEATATPRVTRTSRPTFTPTATDTSTPVVPPTVTPTNSAVPTDTPLVPPTNTPKPLPPTNTPGPRPPTNTPRPPTNTPQPAPPTNTATPQLQFTAGIGDTSRSNNCGNTRIAGQIVNRAGNAIGGFKFHVSADGFKGSDSGPSTNAFSDSNLPTRYNADYTISPSTAKPGKWYVVMVDDNDSPISNLLTVYTDADSEEKPCWKRTDQGGGIQVVPVVFTRN